MGSISREQLAAMSDAGIRNFLAAALEHAGPNVTTADIIRKAGFDNVESFIDGIKRLLDNAVGSREAAMTENDLFHPERLPLELKAVHDITIPVGVVRDLNTHLRSRLYSDAPSVLEAQLSDLLTHNGRAAKKTGQLLLTASKPRVTDSKALGIESFDPPAPKYGQKMEPSDLPFVERIDTASKPRVRDSGPFRIESFDPPAPTYVKPKPPLSDLPLVERIDNIGRPSHTLLTSAASQPMQASTDAPSKFTGHSPSTSVSATTLTKEESWFVRMGTSIKKYPGRTGTAALAALGLGYALMHEKRTETPASTTTQR